MDARSEKARLCIFRRDAPDDSKRTIREIFLTPFADSHRKKMCGYFSKNIYSENAPDLNGIVNVMSKDEEK